MKGLFWITHKNDIPENRKNVGKMVTVDYNEDLEKKLVENGYNVKRDDNILVVEENSEKNSANAGAFLSNLCEKGWNVNKGRYCYQIQLHPDFFIFDGEVMPHFIILKTRK